MAYLSVLTVVVPNFANAQEPLLNLQDAVSIAVQEDPWLTASKQTQEAFASEAIASSSLPDPKISLTAASFPVDSFSSRQEGMTQLIVGVSQTFPRGDTLSLSRKQKNQLAQKQPLLRADRIAKVKTTVTKLWLDVFFFQQSIRLIESDRALFEQLVSTAKASYTSTEGKARQQDVIRAQLELTRLDDRLTSLRQKEERFQSKLSEWIGAIAKSKLPDDVPNLTLQEALSSPSTMPKQALYELIKGHPVLQAIDQDISASETSIELAQQGYKPQWSTNLKYGHRNDAPSGTDRADLFSVGVTFDIPLFTDNKQDEQVRSAKYKTEAKRTEKLLIARQLIASLRSTFVQLNRLNERAALYREELLPQMSAQSEAALTAYNNDDGDFAEAVRSQIAEVNAKIDALAIAINRQKLIAEANYLLFSGV
ncbi:TolC family protein [Pseudidiomarina sp. 1APP75-32.1]|uniref:TolC family protein n=2 Tax=Pseudidiomarina terrestris TaxID=2820060 RepID=A0AAW7QUU9_9GAMM|nr:TolC family protein [Pseudidiomarina sp. 1APP75-32.1]MDN7128235.1 TolC family protein [Pseudidiomarina sp. 1APR75-33.1]MDN7130684.1 TolC family protein [Pseudidiomarina sp. 1APR75-15]MDN7135552.1 TolC family protein [Pseudidiomarina sp. 1ASP75-5]MDN7138950.1 TolC family protein [Pseudidiomarina sp. 1ASP75-14]MEA3588844.1 TolC family protein [Pseudidiomarina sp. 1APP75-27a]